MAFLSDQLIMLGERNTAMTESLRNQLVETGMLHSPLKADLSRSVEARLLEKKALATRNLWDGENLSIWRKDGMGEISVSAPGTLHIAVPPRADHWPEGSSPDGDYAKFGDIRAALQLPRENLEGYNQLVCRIRPTCNGFANPLARLEWRNDGEHKIPDAYYREGFHDINLRNFEWNECVWEFPDLPRDAVTEIAVVINCYGSERGGDTLFHFDVADLRLVQVERPDVSLGWQGNADTIAFSTSGYWQHGQKTAIANRPAERFSLLRAEDGSVAYEGTGTPLQNEKGSFTILDFSDFAAEGQYQLRVDGVTTYPFPIGPHIMEDAAWKVINFLYCERCGYPVGQGHPSCHQDITAEHNGLHLSYCGGWHDAGDVSQQTLQTAEVAHGLLELASRVLLDRPLYKRLVEEASWGLDFVLRMRFGDGYRATSAGACRWTNGLTGDMDDVRARVHNRSFDNFLMAGAEAFAARTLADEDRNLAWKCGQAAREDWRFALERFEAVGMEDCIFFEHTFNASLSQYYAVACWSAAEVAQTTGDAYFAEQAVRFGDLMLACQETGTQGVPMRGFFYREPAHQTIVHFNHQSRDHLFIQALVSLLKAQPEHAKRGDWEQALRLYGEYLKALYPHAAPYGMIPAGLHSYAELDDEKTFPYLHLMTDFESERDNYRQQLDSGIPVAEGYAIRQFPVWFSFRGNTAIHLSQGKAASLIGRYFGDEALLDMAREQLYWVSGKNPFGQSLIYGEGSNYAQQYAALAGEMVGEIPVGIQTRGNEDVPYWPMANNATYKEVWTTSAGHWLWVLADLY